MEISRIKTGRPYIEIHHERDRKKTSKSLIREKTLKLKTTVELIAQNC